MEDFKPLRVAQIIGIAIDGGVESCIMNYYKHIDRTKIQFDFFVESTSKIINIEEIERMGGKVIFIPSYKNIFKYIKALKSLFKNGEYDIVHSNMNALSVFSLYAAKKAKVKYRIAHSHSTANKKEWKKSLLKYLLKPFAKLYATDYFACSNHAAVWLFGNKAVKKNKVTIINNAIDLDKFAFSPNTREKMRKELNVEKKFVVGHIGRFSMQKNQLFILKIFAEFQKTHDNAVMLFIGNGSMLEQAIEKSRELNIYEKCIFFGVHEHPEWLYNCMDCFFFPSLYEGLGIAFVEAQMNGLPCLISDCVPKEAILSNNVEVLSLKSHSNLWVEKLNSFLTVEERFIEKERFNGYDIESEANKLMNNYLSILENDSPC